MRKFPRPFPDTSQSEAPPPLNVITLTGTLPYYNQTPVLGEFLDAHYILSNSSSFASSAGTITSVVHYVRAEQNPGDTVDILLTEAAEIPANPGDILVTRVVVSDSVGNSRSFVGPEVVVPVPTPAIVTHPTPSLGVQVGATSFTVNFGTAGPVGSSAMAGIYTPALTPIFSINGVNKVSELTLVSGTTYQWNGLALTTGSVVGFQASWSNQADNITSNVVAQTASDFGFDPQTDNTAFLNYAEGADVAFNFGDPEVFDGAYTFTVAQQADQPHNAKAPVISGTGTEGQTLTSAPGLWFDNSANTTTVVRQWLRNGTAISGATGATYIVGGADGGTNISFRETVGSKSVVSNSIAIGVSTKTQTFVLGASNASSASANTVSPFTADFSSVPTGAMLIFGVQANTTSNTGGVVSATYGGVACTPIVASVTTASRHRMAFFSATHPGGNPTFAINVSANIFRSQVAVWRVTGTSGAVITTNTFSGASIAGPGNLNLNATAGDLLFVITGAEGNNGATQATSGAGTADYNNTIPTNLATMQAYGEVVATTQTPRSVQTTWSNSTNISGLSVTL